MKQLRSPDEEVYTAIREYVKESEHNNTYHTTRERRRALQRHFRPLLYEYDINRVEDISPDLVEEFVKQRREHGAHGNTITHEVNYIKGLCAYYNHTEFLSAFDMGELNIDTKTIVESSTENKSLSQDEYKKVVREADTLRNELVVRIGWDTGARRSEVSKINVENIDYQEVTINSAKSQNSSNNEEERVSFLSVQTAEKVREYREFERDTYGGSSSTDALFVTQRGRMSPHRLNEIFKELCEDAGIQKELAKNAKGDQLNLYTYHSLRHSFCVQRLKQNMPTKLIADLIGDTVQSVSDTYLQTSKEDLRKAENEYRPTVRI